MPKPVNIISILAYQYDNAHAEAATGNKPPWSVPAKAVYGSKFEGPRAIAYFDRSDIRPPKDLMARAHTILPLRTLHYIKRTYAREIYHAVLEKYFDAFWTPPNLNLTQVDLLAKVIAESGKFSPKECEAILAAARTQEIKDLLTGATQDALEKGAFGAPWLWVTNGEGRGEPFFGSDRFVSSKIYMRKNADPSTDLATCTNF